MDLSLRGIAAEIGKTFLKSVEADNSIKETVRDEILQKAATIGNFAEHTTENLSDVFASRPGLSTALDSSGVRLKCEECSSDRQFDGCFVGIRGQVFSPNTPLSEITAVSPSNGVRNPEVLIFVNGTRTSIARMTSILQAIADKTGSPVIGIHNATEGFSTDIQQNFAEKFDIGKNPPVDTLAETVYDELRAGREVHLLTHLQGSLVLSRALQDVKNRLMLEGALTRRDAEALMNGIKVEIFGGAARRYTDGPQYVHYVNRSDGVSKPSGLRPWLNPFAHEGAGAVMYYFHDGNPLVSYDFEEFYLTKRVPFETARARHW